MQTLEAKFQIVTPMFMGDANQGASDGVRPPSVKGMLRFWWRALNWGRFRSQSSCDEAALIFLHEEESRLFGNAVNEGGGGQGVFLLTVQHNELERTEKGDVHKKFKPEKTVIINGKTKIDQNHMGGARYLGYGLMAAFRSQKKQEEAGQLFRSCINENQNFKVKLIFKKAIDPTIRNALITLGMLGGMGSRSRHGLGSIALLELREGDKVTWCIPASVADYSQKLKEELASICTGTTVPPFSAFSQESKVDTLITGRTIQDVLDSFGKAMSMYRSWGKFGSVLGLPAEQRFKDDHDWFRVVGARTANPNFHPARVVFGLPHNYDKFTINHVTPEDSERRASPLFFHVQPVGGNYIGVSFLLKSQFLPDKELINAGGKKVPANINWSLITNFIDGTTGNPPGPTKRFPNRIQMIP